MTNTATNLPEKSEKQSCLVAFGLIHYIKRRAPNSKEKLNRWHGRVNAALHSECRFNSVINWDEMLSEINSICESEGLATY